MTKTILIADDSRSIRQMVGATLREAGYEVLEAENGQQSLDAASGQPLSLVLTDLNMPVVDGLSFIRGLRAMPEHRSTPVLMVTTESQLSRKEEARVAGANGWVVKPIQPDRLLHVVRQVAQ